MDEGYAWHTQRMPTRHRRIQVTEDRRALLDSLAKGFDEPAATGVDWDVLREGKRLAWPAPPGARPDR